MASNPQKRNVLVVAAHPDDEVLGCGAAIWRHSEAGDRVCVLILGEGITSRKYLAPAAQRKGLRALRADARRASKILGTERLILRAFPDNQFDCVPLLQIVQSVEEVIAEWNPQIVYTHHAADVNIDHRRTAEAVEVALRPMPGSSIEAILSFEVPSSSEWNFIRSGHFHPNVFLAASEAVIEKKVQALRAYRNEIRLFPHPRSPEYIRALSKIRGAAAGFISAEAFRLLLGRQA